MDIINRNKSIMEPFDETICQVLLNLHIHAVNPDPFYHQ